MSRAESKTEMSVLRYVVPARQTTVTTPVTMVTMLMGTDVRTIVSLSKDGHAEEGLRLLMMCALQSVGTGSSLGLMFAMT